MSYLHGWCWPWDQMLSTASTSLSSFRISTLACEVSFSLTTCWHFTGLTSAWDISQDLLIKFYCWRLELEHLGSKCTSKQNEFETRDDRYIMRPWKLPEGIKTFIWQVHVFSHTQSPIHVVGNRKPSCHELLRQKYYILLYLCIEIPFDVPFTPTSWSCHEFSIR